MVARCFKLFLLLLISFVYSNALISQKLRFNQFGPNDGIKQSFIYTIDEDKNGYIMMGTGKGIARYDGINFNLAPGLDSIVNDVVRCSYKDKFGNLWYGFNNSTIVVWDGNQFQKINDKENNIGAIIGFGGLKNGEIVIAAQNGTLLVSHNYELREYSNRLSDLMISCILLDDKNLLIGSMEGLFNLRLDDNEQVYELHKIEGLNFINIQCIEKTPWSNFYVIGTEGDGLYLVYLKSTQTRVKKLGNNNGLEMANVHDLHFDNNDLWICTFNDGLLNMSGLDSSGYFTNIEKYTENDGVASDYIKTMHTDYEGNLWVGTYGNGFSILKGRSFEFMSLENYFQNNNITAIESSPEKIWYASRGDLLEEDIISKEKILISKETILPKDNITCLKYAHGYLWIGTQKNGLYRLDTENYKIKNYFRRVDNLSKKINYINADNENIYLATGNGIFILNIETGEEQNFTNIDGISHNDVKHILIDKQSRLFYATKGNGISEINLLNEIVDYFKIEKYEMDFNSITQDYKGNIWTCANGDGVFHSRGDTIINLTINNGLKSNYCYGIICSDSNYVWVGHREGLSRISIYDYSIKLFDYNIGINGYVNLNSFDIVDNKLLFGTTDGVIIYNIEEGKKLLPPPRANIKKVVITDVEYDFRNKIELPYDIYRLRIDFVGLNYNNPQEVKYQYKLDGYDIDWANLTSDTYANYPRVEDGKYTFLLRAYSNNGLTEEDPVSVEIKVNRPIWKRWWFIAIIVALVILGVLLIIQWRERRQRQIKEYLEQRLDERTKEVVEQKEEIEIKNRDITDSINYAQRIQTSILPPIKKLQSVFSGSFVFYQPRDIVSGDFYWFDSMANDKFIIVCADSTGHGVPGAFMSMIGTTLLKDICMRSDVDSPSRILQALDCELRNTLNQDITDITPDEEEKSNDGMDIIVCEINTTTNYMRYSSAMRPMIVYRNGEQIYLKGSRSSVGGHYDKEVKDFKDEGIQLSKGDLVYMFSDGYPDQFGGPLKKKFKMVRLKNLLKDINKKPMEEQYEYVKSTFNLWKEDLPQVDDVLFMGVKI